MVPHGVSWCFCVQLTMASESGGGGVIVVMAKKKKPWMDGVFVDNLEDWRGSKIVTRKGDPLPPIRSVPCACMLPSCY